MMTTSIKQNLFRVAILLLIGIFLVPAIASAFRNGDRNCERGMGMHGKGMQWESYHMWDNPKVVEELGLTDEQVGELKEADLAMKENHMELRSQLNQLFMDRVESRLKMTKILTAEQLEKLETLQPGPCEGRGKFGKYDKRCKDNWKNDTTRQ